MDRGSGLPLSLRREPAARPPTVGIGLVPTFISAIFGLAAVGSNALDSTDVSTATFARSTESNCPLAQKRLFHVSRSNESWPKVNFIWTLRANSHNPQSDPSP